MSPRVSLLLFPLVVLVVTSACHAPWHAGGPQARCVQQCRAMQVRACDDDACARGCDLSSDRIVEQQDALVRACVQRVASKHKRCDDAVWATCAVRVGPYADGGPPAPTPAPDVFDDE